MNSCLGTEGGQVVLGQTRAIDTEILGKGSALLLSLWGFQTSSPIKRGTSHREYPAVKMQRHQVLGILGVMVL